MKLKVTAYITQRVMTKIEKCTLYHKLDSLLVDSSYMQHLLCEAEHLPFHWQQLQPHWVLPPIGR